MSNSVKINRVDKVLQHSPSLLVLVKRSPGILACKDWILRFVTHTSVQYLLNYLLLHVVVVTVAIRPRYRSGKEHNISKIYCHNFKKHNQRLSTVLKELMDGSIIQSVLRLYE